MSTGHRAYPDDEYFLGEPGSYWKHKSLGTWYCVTPEGQYGNLTRHDVVEHDDGTITVSPSILITGHEVPEWHGYLERGEWRKV
jgi:hypothetical protein